MKEKNPLYQTYSDLLDPSTDAKLVQLIQELDDICRKPATPSRVTWSHLRNMHMQQGTHEEGKIIPFCERPRLRYLFARKAVLIPALIGLVLITAAFTFAFSPLLQSMLAIEPSGSGLLSSHAFADLNKAVTIGGRTITLEAGYADANQVILGYTVSPSSSKGRLWLSSTLTTNAGLALPGMVAGDTIQGKDFAEAWHFDASAIPGNPATLSLHLVMGLQEISAATAPVDTPGKMPPVQTLGFAAVNFTLPFHAGKSIPADQQVTSQGKTGTLLKCVVTQSATRIVLHIDGLTNQPSVPGTPTGEGGNLPTSVTLTVPGRNTVPPEFVGTSDVSKDLILFYPYNFADNVGTWTLTVKSGTRTWIFQLNVSR